MQVVQSSKELSNEELCNTVFKGAFLKEVLKFAVTHDLLSRVGDSQLRAICAVHYGIHDGVEVSGNVGRAERFENFTLVVHLLYGLPPAHVKGKHSKHEFLLALPMHRSHAGEFHCRAGVVDLCYFQVIANSV